MVIQIFSNIIFKFLGWETTIILKLSIVWYIFRIKYYWIVFLLPVFSLL